MCFMVKIMPIIKSFKVSEKHNNENTKQTTTHYDAIYF